MSLFQTEPLALTTLDSCSAFVWQRQRALPARGIVLGIDHLAGRARFAYDPWTLYEDGVIRAPSALVMGQIGNGKSTLVKAYCRRQIIAGRQAFILDPKGEYGPFAAMMDLPTIALRPGGQLRVNPLDPGPLGAADEDGRTALRQRRIGLVRALLASSIGREPTPAESAALDAAIDDGDARHGSNLLLGHVVEAMMTPTDEMARSLAISRPALTDAIRDGAYGLRRLVRGDLAGMFDGPTNIALRLDGRGIVVDLSAVYGSDALGPVMAASSTWLMQAIATSSRQRVLVLDEAWAVLRNPTVTAWLQATNKLARSLGVSLVIVMHRLSDLGAQADAGSASAAQAKGLLADSETQVILHQPEAEADNLARALALSPREIEIVSTLPPFMALWRIGRHRALVEHVVTRSELAMADTDAAMRNPLAGAAVRP